MIETEKRCVYLSICIPTYNRQDILKNTLQSIYSDLQDIPLAEFEVIVSDNSKEATCKDVVSSFNYENIHYYVTNCEGFMNSFYALSYGCGAYLKLHNNYTMFKKGTLKELLLLIKKDIDRKPFYFFSNGLLNTGKITSFSSFDEFMNNLTYFSSWSSGFGIWKDNFDNCKNTQLDRWFPQTSLLLTQTKKNEYLINDKIIFLDQFVPKKGGYNIFKVFCIDYLKLIRISFFENQISGRTFNHIKNRLLYNYIAVRFFKTVIARIDNFETTDIKESVLVNYSKIQYYFMLFLACLTPITIVYRKVWRKKHS